MNIFAWLRLLGRSLISHEIKVTFDNHLSAAGAVALAGNLDAASKGLRAGDHQAAADALADVVLAIH